MSSSSRTKALALGIPLALLAWAGISRRMSRPVPRPAEPVPPTAPVSPPVPVPEAETLRPPDRSLPAPNNLGMLAFSPAEDVLAAAFGDRILLWDTQSWTRRELEVPEVAGWEGVSAEMFAFSPDGRKLAVVRKASSGSMEDHSLLLWDLPGGRALWSVSTGGEFAVFSPDGRHLTHCNRQGSDGKTPTSDSIWIRDAATGNGGPLLKVGPDMCGWTAWPPAGDRLIYNVDRWDKGFRRFDVSLTKERRLKAVPGAPPAVEGEGERLVRSGDMEEIDVMNQDASLFAALGSMALVIFDGNGREVKRLNEDSGRDQNWGGSPVFSPDGRLLAAPAGYPGQKIRIWDTASWRLLMELDARGIQRASILDFDRKNRWFAAGSAVGSESPILIWKLEP